MQKRVKVLVIIIVAVLISTGIGGYCLYAHDRDIWLDSVCNHYFAPESRNVVKDMVNSDEQTIDAGGYHFVLKEYIYESTVDYGYFLIEVTKKGTNMNKLFEDYKGEAVKGALESGCNIVPEYVLEITGVPVRFKLEKETTRNKIYIYGQFESNPIMEEDSFKIGIRKKYINQYGVLIDESASPEGEFELKGTECSKMYKYGKNNIFVTPFMLFYHQTKYNEDMLPEFEIYFKDGSESEMYDSNFRSYPDEAEGKEYGDNVRLESGGQSSFEINGEFYEDKKFDCYYFTNPVALDEIERIETCGEEAEFVK